MVPTGAPMVFCGGGGRGLIGLTRHVPTCFVSTAKLGGPLLQGVVVVVAVAAQKQ